MTPPSNRISSPNTNRKRARDEPSPRKPAKRQNTHWATSNTASQNTVSITRRINECETRLQTLEAEHAVLSQDGDPDTISRAKRLLGATAIRRGTAATKLNKVKEAIKQMAKTIRDCHDVVPALLHQALKASQTDYNSSEGELQEIKRLEAEQIQQLKDTELKYRQADSKRKELSKQIDRCKLNLRRAEWDLDNALLQQRIDALSHVDVSTLAFNERLRVSKFVQQIAEIVD
ncbi:hypothetical protein FPSE5266_01895 [Fusarium pseudograminearum]|nr:hypothetical protein FPSE5266_01895 [Fusarium pseudograminearum]